MRYPTAPFTSFGFSLSVAGFSLAYATMIVALVWNIFRAL
jgi:hypothetical protein